MISLAVKCKLITIEQETEIITLLFKRIQESPEKEYSAKSILKEQNILSSEDLNFLLSVKRHLETKILDKKFGRLAVANDLVHHDAIKKTLNQQRILYKKSGKTLPLGSILVQKKMMSEADSTALLLTQNRIKDKYLADAMNKIAVTELEKIGISKRFGSIAVKNNFMSMEKINLALKIQKNDRKNGLPSRFLGEILEESFDLSPKATIKILKEQKQYEKRRLNLEKALSQYNSEIKMNQMISKAFEYSVSQGKLEAYIRINQNFSEDIKVHNLLNWIKLMGVKFGLLDNISMGSFLETASKGSEIKIAQGIPAQKGEPASIEFYFDFDADKEPSFVEKGKILAKRIPHKEGIPGKNVFGQTILPPQIDTCPLRGGDGILNKNEVFIAKNDGFPMLYEQRTLFIRPLEQKTENFNISGDMLLESEDKYKTSNLIITGNILHGDCLECHELEIDGNVFRDIVATGDIKIKGSVERKSDTEKKSDPQLTITSFGNISIDRKVENAKIITNKVFQAINADVIASTVSAYHGIVIKNVYSHKTKPTVLHIGKKIDSELKKLRADIDQKVEELRKLKGMDEMEEIEEKLHMQIHVQDDYREKQNALTYLIKIMGNVELEEFDTKKKGFDFFETKKDDDTKEKIPYGIPQQTKAYAYFQKTMEKIEKESPKVQSRIIKEMLEENIDMYKTAINATERMEKEYFILSELTQNAIERDEKKIKKVEKELDKIIVQKEFFLLNDKKNYIKTTPEIRIKNQLSQGTIIKGMNSSLSIDKTIYGVKLKEITNQNKSKIIIEGYFD